MGNPSLHRRLTSGHMHEPLVRHSFHNSHHSSQRRDCHTCHCSRTPQMHLKWLMQMMMAEVVIGLESVHKSLEMTI